MLHPELIRKFIRNIAGSLSCNGASHVGSAAGATTGRRLVHPGLGGSRRRARWNIVK